MFMVVLTRAADPVSEVTIVPLFQMFLRWGMVNTHWPLILVPIFGAPSLFATFVMRQFFIAPAVELEEAAKVDGLGRFVLADRAAADNQRWLHPSPSTLSPFLEPLSRADRVPDDARQLHPAAGAANMSTSIQGPM